LERDAQRSIPKSFNFTFGIHSHVLRDFATLEQLYWTIFIETLSINKRR